MVFRQSLTVFVCAFMSISTIHAQKNSALNKVLNAENLTPVPAGNPDYKPGTLVVFRSGASPDPNFLDKAIANMTAQPAQLTITGFTMKTDNEFSLAATLFGVPVKPSVSHGTTLTTDPMQLQGWELSPEALAAITDPNSPTFKKAEDLWNNKLGWKNWKLYVIKAVYTTSHVKVSSSNSTGISFGDNNCDKSKTTDSASDTKNKNASTPSTNTAGQQGKNTKTNSSDSNPIASDVNAVGTQTTSIINAVDGKSGSGSGASGNSSGTKGGSSSSTSPLIANIFKDIAPSISVCPSSSSNVQIDTTSPFPVAMIVEEISFERDFVRMNLLPKPVNKW